MTRSWSFRDDFRPAKHSLRVRLAALYGGIFLALGILVLAIPFLVGRASSTSVEIRSGGGFDPAVGRAIIRSQQGTDLHQQLVLSLLAVVVLVGLSLAVGWILAGRILRPLREITATTQEITASNLHRRLAIEGPYDELNELGATLDDLMARLEASFISQRNFVSNASHELRTPLTAERALLQVALADPDPSVTSLRSVCEELVELGGSQERLIDDLLTLAQSEAGIERSERFDLFGVARTAVRVALDEASARGVDLDVSGIPAPVYGDRRLVAILVGNLIDNAIRHNAVGGHANVRTSHSGRGSTVAVSNSGPVVAEEDVLHLCEPFLRPGSTRRLHVDGYGLGLTIVRAVADAHGAELHIRVREHGGLAVSVTFPVPRLDA